MPAKGAHPRFKQVARGSTIFVVAVGIGFLIGAVQILPSLEYFLDSYRRFFTGSPVPLIPDFDSVSFDGMEKLRCLLFPDCFGSPQTGDYHGPGNYNTLNTPFSGVVAVILSVFSLLWLKIDKRILFFLLLFSIFASCFYVVPFAYNLVKQLPLMTRVGNGYFGLGMSFSLSVLSAIGLEQLVTTIRERLRLNKMVASSLGVVVLLTVIVELFVFGREYNPSSEKSDIYPDTEVTDFLMKDESLYRIAYDSDVFPASSNMPYRIQSVFGSDVIEPVYYSIFLTALNNLPSTVSIAAIPYLLKLDNPAFFQALNIKYFVTRQRLDSDFLSLAYDGPTRIYENDHFLERAHIVHNAVFVDDYESLVQLIDVHDFRESVLADVRDKERLEDMMGTPANAEAESVTVVRYSANTVVLDVEMKGKGILVLSDNYYPGWVATVDGNREEILRVNLTYRGVALPAGRHQVVFEYRPGSFYAGMWLSILGFFLCLFLLILRFKLPVFLTPQRL